MSTLDPSVTGDLTAVTLPRQLSRGRFHLDVPEGWQQGRGAFGGLVLAAATRAILASEPDAERRVRAVNAEIAGPVTPGEATIHVTEIRRGSGLTAYDAVMAQGDQGQVRVSAVLARARAGHKDSTFLTAPAPVPWEQATALPREMGPFAPMFATHFEYRLTGPFPFTGGTEPVVAGWVRPRRAGPLGAPEVVALVDAYWPASFTIIPSPRPAATVAYSAQLFLPEQTLDPSVPLYYRARVIAEQDGYILEHRELWTPDGRLIIFNQQTFAWIK